MAIWSAEIKELERLNVSLIGHFPEIEKEMGQLVKTEDENVAMLYSRRCLEIIITDLCECELKRPRKTEPLKGIIDKLNKEEKVASYIITSMHSLNSLSTYGAHPKDFDPEQVKPALSNLAIILKWYLKYKGIEILSKPSIAEEDSIAGTGKQVPDATKLEKSIAILPFKNDSKDEENTYFINGLMDEILNNLQKIKDLRVISRTSVEQYRNQTKSIPEIAKELGVNYIVEGSGQKYGNAFRLRTQLIMAAKESHLWGESYQQKISDAEDIFRIQSQIAESIAKELKAVITPQEKELIEKIPTSELEAYDAYLQGRSYWRKLTPNDLETAMHYYERAKEIDPGYALAYAGICDVWIGRQQMGFVSAEEAGPKAIEAVMKALELDSTLAEVHYTLALMNLGAIWDWQAGEEAFKKTFEINSNHAEAHAYYSHLLYFLGRSEEGMKEINLALKLDPYNPLLKALYCFDLSCEERYEDVILTARETLKMDPTSIIAQIFLAVSLIIVGKHKEGIENYKSAFIFYGFKEVVPAFDFGYINGGYIGALNQAAETLIEISKTKYVLPSLIGDLYTFTDDLGQALNWYERCYNEHDPNLPYMFPQKFFSNKLGDNSRYQELARKMNLPYK